MGCSLEEPRQSPCPTRSCSCRPSLSHTFTRIRQARAQKQQPALWSQFAELPLWCHHCLVRSEGGAVAAVGWNGLHETRPTRVAAVAAPLLLLLWAGLRLLVLLLLGPAATPAILLLWLLWPGVACIHVCDAGP